MKTAPASKSIPAWQTERAAKLQRACKSIKAAIQRGEKIGRAIRRVSRRIDGRPYKSDPCRRLALSPATLRRLWDRWNRTGELPAAFKLNYFVHRLWMPRELLIRFAKYCADHRLPSLKQAWLNFSLKHGNARARQFSYNQLVYVFPSATFNRLQGFLKASEMAEAGSRQLLFKTIADITDRMPLRAPRPRVAVGASFEI